MKYVYVLVSNENDTYYEQLLLSATSLRLKMPDAFITLIVDDVTAKSLKNERSQILQLINEFKVVSVNKDYSSMMRSRHLKTSMRNLIEGDFLYIDNDTIIDRPLEIPLDFCGEIGAVLDFHVQINDNISKKSIYRRCKILKFSPILNDNYFNTGVLFVRDTEKTRTFFLRWNELWLYCTTKNIFLDQPSFAQTDYEFGYIIKELSGEWNCQLQHGLNFLHKANIIHYFNSIRSNSYFHQFVNNKAFKKLKENRDITESVLEMIQNVKSLFHPKSRIVGPLDSEILNTQLYYRVRSFYLRMPRMFAYLDKIIFSISKLRKKFRNK